MSGGHFNDSGYIYWQVWQFADELETDLNNNNREIDGWTRSYNKETVDALRPYVDQIRNLSTAMKAIDYLFSGDYGEEETIEMLKKLNLGHDKNP